MKSEIIIYQTQDGLTKIDLRMEGETVWLTQAGIVELFQSSKANISEHLKHIFKEGELLEDSVVRKFRTTAADSKTYNIKHYNLDAILAAIEKARHEYDIYRAALSEDLTEVEKAYLDTLRDMQKKLKDGDGE